MGAPLDIYESRERGAVRLTLVGELDISTAAALKERLMSLHSHALFIRLDLSELEFIDSSGLHVLLEAVHDAGGLLEVEPELAPQVKRVLELTHTDRLLVAGPSTNG